jgi:hypothetical protein
MRSSKLIIESSVQKQMARFGFGRKFHDLDYFEIDFFFHIPGIHSKVQVIIKFYNFCRK